MVLPVEGGADVPPLCCVPTPVSAMLQLYVRLLSPLPVERRAAEQLYIRAALSAAGHGEAAPRPAAPGVLTAPPPHALITVHTEPIPAQPTSQAGRKAGGLARAPLGLFQHGEEEVKCKYLYFWIKWVCIYCSLVSSAQLLFNKQLGARALCLASYIRWISKLIASLYCC